MTRIIDQRTIPRVITLGDSGVGKTALISRMKTGEFLQSTTPTIGAGVTLVEVDIDSKHDSLQLWDTAGQELYRSIIPVYFKGAVLAILVFSITDLNSFRHLDTWLLEISQHADANIHTVIVASKFDSEDVRVEESEAKKYAEDRHLKLFFTSSLTGQNVQSLLEYIALTLSAKVAALNEPTAPTARQPADEPHACC
jgi:small GTP-binding protein